jgi:hypothetical protein
MRLQLPVLLSLFYIALPAMVVGQEFGDSLLNKLNNTFFKKIENTVAKLESSIEKKTLKLLNRLQKQENKLQKKLALKDSSAAANLFSSSAQQYKKLADQIKDPACIKPLKEYLPGLDSLKTSVAFLQKAEALKGKLPTNVTTKVVGLDSKIQGLESKLQQGNEVKKYIRERKQQLKEQFEKYGLGKELKKLNKEVYYYQQQLNEYKAILKDPKKMQDRAIAEIKKLPLFKDFMKEHSQLAALFAVPENYGTPASLAGLQTRASIQAQIHQRFAGTNVNPQQYTSQQMNVAQGELNKLKDKINKLGGGSSDMDMPDFKPNSQKTKSFWKRMEYGFNLQSQKQNGILPVSSDLALSAGYKLNDKSVIGISLAYKMGWGNGWKNIKLTHEGVGLRSFIDYKIKGGFWISGGYEQNYNQAFVRYDQLRQFSAWQTSGLIGITKKTRIGKKVQNTQLLWDFMSYGQEPRSAALQFRVGMAF